MAWAPQTLEKIMPPGSTLKILWGCDHTATYTRDEAFRLFGEQADPMYIRRYARCKCGARNPGKVWV